MTDIFKFWSMIGKADTIHPLDRPVFDRLNDSHGFDLRCLPCNFGGKLRTAPAPQGCGQAPLRGDSHVMRAIVSSYCQGKVESS